MKTFAESKREYLDKIKKVSDRIIEINKSLQKEYQRRKKQRDTFGIWLRKHYERKGFVTDTQVEHIKLKTVHIIKAMFYHNDVEDMVLIVKPPIDKGGKPVTEFRVKKIIKE